MEQRENEPTGRTKNWRSYVTDGVLIAVVPFMAYELNFIYEAGNGTFYGIPNSFVSFSLSSTISTLALVLGSLALVINQVIGSFNIKRAQTGSSSIVIENSFLLILFGLFIWTTGSRWFSASAYFLLIALIQIVRFFIWPLFLRKGERYSYRVNTRIKKVYTSKNDTVLDYVFNFIFYKISTYIIVLAGVLSLVFTSGYASAERQVSYYVLSNQKGWVVVRLIDDNAVLERVKGKQLTNEIKYMSIKDSNISMKKIEVGPLLAPTTK